MDRYTQIKKLRESGKSCREIGERYGVSSQAISAMLKRHFPWLKRIKKQYPENRCGACGKKFLVIPGGNGKYCTRKCFLEVRTKGGITSSPEYKRERDRLRVRRYYASIKGKHIIKKLQNKYRKMRPRKASARSLVRHALVTGKLLKPTFCSSCNKTGLRIEAHHTDYSKALEVVWLCSLCHRSLHKNA